jgi:sugar-specific transcriptional regulator TrmB
VPGGWITSSQFETRVQTLKRFGLTQYQAIVYLALEELGITTAKDIAKKSGIPRSKVYESLDALQELGIANKIITTPASFEASPPSKAMSFLLKRKLKDYQNLRTEKKSILRTFGKKHRDISNTKASKIVFVSDKEAIVSCMKRLVENAEDSIDLVTSWKRFSKISVFSDAFAKAKNKGVRIRLVVQMPKNRDSLKKVISSIGILHCEYRTISFAPSAIICIYDEKHVMIFTEAETRVKDSPIMVTDNSCFVEVTKVYFQKMWLTSQLYKQDPESHTLWLKAA